MAEGQQIDNVDFQVILSTLGHDDMNEWNGTDLIGSILDKRSR